MISNQEMPFKAALFLSGVALISFIGFLLHKYPDFFSKKSCSYEYIHKLSEHYEIKNFENNLSFLNETVLHFFVTEDDPYFKIEDPNGFNILFEYNDEKRYVNLFLNDSLCGSLTNVRFSDQKYTKLSTTFQEDGFLVVNIEGDNLRKTFSCRTEDTTLSEEAKLTIGYKNGKQLEKFYYDCPANIATPWRYHPSSIYSHGLPIKRRGAFSDVTITKKDNGNVEIQKNFNNLFKNMFSGWKGNHSGNITINKQTYPPIKDQLADNSTTVTINRRGSFRDIRISKDQVDMSSANRDYSINHEPLENINISNSDGNIEVSKSWKRPFMKIEKTLGKDDDFSNNITIDRGPFGYINISKNNAGVQIHKSLGNNDSVARNIKIKSGSFGEISTNENTNYVDY